MESEADRRSNFSLDYLESLLTTAARGRTPVLLKEVPSRIAAGSDRLLCVRHDIDLDPSAARRVAELEHGHGLRATYLFMSDSPTYRLDERRVLDDISFVAGLGHEIGLHALVPQEIADGSADDIAAFLERQRPTWEKTVGYPLRSVSFHRPVQSLLRGPSTIAGCTNAYAAVLMEHYVSDSRARWRVDDPLEAAASPSGRVLQLLIHPIWWGAEDMSGEDRLERYFLSRTRDMSSTERASFDEGLAGHLSIRRRGWRDRSGKEYAS